ncbi:ML domain-containing protein [Streptomyces sp. NPDC054854]
MANWMYVNAGTPEDALQIESVSATPDPPKPGSSLRFDIKATAQGKITEGAYVDVTVKLGLIKLLHKQYDLFQLLKGDTSNGWTLTRTTGSSSDPIEPGSADLVFAWDAFPREIPPAKFTIALRAYTVDDNDLFALDFKLDFMKPSGG